MARRRLLYHYFYLTYGGERYSEEVTVSPFSPGGGADGFSVMSSKAWEVLSSPSWLWMSTDEGEKGMTQIQISAGTYAGGDVREDNITIRTIDGRYTAMIHVSQMADVPYITVTGQPAGAVSFRNEYTVLSVSSKGGWTAAVTGATLNPTAQTDVESIETEVYVTYGKNTSTSDTRTVTVVFTNTQDPTKSVTVTITQAPQSYIDLQCDHTTPVPYTGGTVVFTAETNYTSTISAPAGVALSLTAISPGSTEITATFAPLSTGQTGDVTWNITGQTNDYLPADGIDSDELSLLQGRYPYIDATGTTCDSAATTGSVSYQSNYMVAAGTGTSTGLTNVVIENNQAKFDFVNPPSWNEETYSLQLVTVGTFGPDVTTSVTVTREAKVAELTVQSATIPKTSGTVTITYETNDDDVIVTGLDNLPSWLHNPVVDKVNKTITFDVDENTGSTDRTFDFTITTEHNGADGNPVSRTATVTQSANNDRSTDVTMNLWFKQNDEGKWYYKVSMDGSKFYTTDNIEFTMRLNNVSASAVTADDTDTAWTETTCKNTAGVEFTGITYAPSSVVFNRPDGGKDTYNITYVTKEKTPYSETVVGYANVTLYELSYLDDEVNAAGTETVRPTAYTVAYQEVITNSFDGTSRTGTTKYETLTVRNNNLSKLTGTTQNTGSFTEDIGVTAASRGATASTSSRDVATITGGTFSFSGNTYSTGIDVPKTITQQKNEAYCEEYVVCGSTSTRTTTEYRNSGFTTSPSSYTYHASGGTRQFTVRVTADTRTNTATTYDVTPHTACTYDSGSETDEAGRTESQTDWKEGTWRPNYNEPARFWKASGDTTWFTTPNTGGSKYSPITVTASSRGTTAGNARPNAYLVFDSPLNLHDEVAIPINQSANTRTCDGGTTSTRTTREEKSPEYESVRVSISASETSFKANGKTHNGNNYATITASETARTRTVTAVTTYTDTAYTCQWSSKATESWTDVDNTGVTTTEYGDWQTYYPTPVISKKASTGSSLSYDSTNQRVTATNLGTVTGETNSIQIQAVSTVDASKTDTVTLNQDVNTVTGKTCDLDVSPTSIQFTDTTTSSTVSITSRTTTEYASEATKTDAATPNVSISGDSQHFAQTMTLISSSGVYRGTVTSTYPSTPGGPTSPLAYVKYSSPDCPSETESVKITYNGPAQNVYPTIVGVNASVHSQYNTLGISVNFNTSNATPNLTWEFKITGQTVPIFSDGTIILTLTGKTNSMGNGVQNIKVISQDGSWYTDEFTLEMVGSNILTITTPYQQGRTFTFNATCTQQPQAF